MRRKERASIAQTIAIPTTNATVQRIVSLMKIALNKISAVQQQVNLAREYYHRYQRYQMMTLV